MPLALLALAIGAFGIGSTEFAVMGVLPDIAADMGVTISQGGYLISAYALGVVVGAPLLTASSTRFTRKRLLLAMTAIFTVGNAAAALAPNYGFLLAARVLTALPHGAFFGVGAVVAAGLVAADRRARAVSLMFLGLTVANILGVPATTALGHAFGWRLTFALIAGTEVIAAIGIALLVPADRTNPDIHLRAELRAFARPQLWLALAVATLGFSGLFAVYAYIAPSLSALAGGGAVALTIALTLFGLGMTVGNLVGGRLADRALMPSLYAGLGGLSAAAMLFAIAAHNLVTALVPVFLIGLAGAAVVPGLQVRIMTLAGDAPTMAAATVQSALNIANAVGAALGGLVITAGFGYRAPALVGAALALAGLVLALVSGAQDRRLAAIDHGG
jgi:DHA1 family inner membrane transport protein